MISDRRQRFRSRLLAKLCNAVHAVLRSRHEQARVTRIAAGSYHHDSLVHLCARLRRRLLRGVLRRQRVRSRLEIHIEILRERRRASARGDQAVSWLITSAGCDVRVLCDAARHLIVDPMSVADLHEAAVALGIKRCWFHRDPKHPHYDVPKRRVAEIASKCELVSTREICAVLAAWRRAPERP